MVGGRVQHSPVRRSSRNSVGGRNFTADSGQGTGTGTSTGGVTSSPLRRSSRFSRQSDAGAANNESSVMSATFESTRAHGRESFGRVIGKHGFKVRDTAAAGAGPESGGEIFDDTLSSSSSIPMSQSQHKRVLTKFSEKIPAAMLANQSQDSLEDSMMEALTPAQNRAIMKKHAVLIPAELIGNNDSLIEENLPTRAGMKQAFGKFGKKFTEAELRAIEEAQHEEEVSEEEDEEVNEEEEAIIADKPPAPVVSTSRRLSAHSDQQKNTNENDNELAEFAKPSQAPLQTGNKPAARRRLSMNSVDTQALNEKSFINSTPVKNAQKKKFGIALDPVTPIPPSTAVRAANHRPSLAGSAVAPLNRTSSRTASEESAGVLSQASKTIGAGSQSLSKQRGANQSEAGTCAGAGPSRRIAHPADPLTSISPSTPVKAIKPVRLNILTDPFDLDELNAAEKISLGTKKKSRTQTLRSRSTANAPNSDSSSEAEDVASFIIPRKKKASKVSSMTASEVYAGVLSQASKTSITIGAGSQSSSQQRGANQPEAGTDAGAGPSRRIAHPGAITEAELHAIEEAQHEEEVSEEEEEDEVVIAEKPSVQVVSTSRRLSTHSEQQKIPEKISLGTKKKSRTQTLRSRSTANAPNSDLSSEAEDVSSVIIPRKKKASKVSSMTASEVHAGVLSSTTAGAGSQSSPSQQRGANQPEAGTDAGAGPSRRIAHPGPITETELHAIEEAQHEEEVSEEEEEEEVVIAEKPSVQVVSTSRRLSTHSEQQKIPEKISLGTKKKSRTQTLRSRSTANAPNSDLSSEAEDVSSVIIPRKKKASKVSSMTASEVHAGVLSSTTAGAGSQSSPSQQRGANQPEAGTDAGAGPSRRIAHPGPITETELHAIEEAQHEEEVSEEEEEEEVVIAEKPSVQVVSTSRRLSTHSEQQKIPEKISLGTEKKSRTQTLRSRSTANSPNSDLSSEAEDVSSVIIPRKKKASKVSSMTASEVHAGVLSSTTVGAGSQSSSPSQQRGANQPEAGTDAGARPSRRIAHPGPITETELHAIEEAQHEEEVSEEEDEEEVVIAEKPSVQVVSTSRRLSTHSEQQKIPEKISLGTKKKSRTQTLRSRSTANAPNSDLSSEAEDVSSVIIPRKKKASKVSSMTASEVHAGVLSSTTVGAGSQSSSPSQQRGANQPEAGTDAGARPSRRIAHPGPITETELHAIEEAQHEEEVSEEEDEEEVVIAEKPSVQVVSTSRRLSTHSEQQKIPEKISLGTKKKSRTQTLRSRSTANAPNSDLSSEAEDVSSVIIPRKKKASKVSSMTASEVHAGVLSSTTAGAGSQSSSPSQQRGANQPEAGTSASAGPSRRIAHPGAGAAAAVAAPKKALQKRLKPEIEEADWNKTRESALVAAKQRKKKAAADLRSNANMISKEKIAGFLMAMGEELSKTELNRYHAVANTMIEKFLDKLCSTTSNPNGMFSYQELEKALKAQGWISGKKNTLALEFATAFTPEKLHKMTGFLIPNPGEDDTNFDHIYD